MVILPPPPTPSYKTESLGVGPRIYKAQTCCAEELIREGWWGVPLDLLRPRSDQVRGGASAASDAGIPAVSLLC